MMMSFGPRMFRRVTVIGVGLIGGSIAKAIKQNQLAKEVVGFSQKQTSLAIALKNQIIDEGHQDVKRAVKDADLVILATPVSVITGMLTMIGPHIKRNCIVTDVGSTKSAIVAAAQGHLPNPSFFVGSHPLAGSEKKGVQFATAELFKGSTCIMTPLKSTNRGAVERLKRLWIKIGMRVKTLSPEDHDKILAYISHFPHIVAYALMETIPPEYLDYATQGLKDTTRVASSTPQVWNDICMGNSRNIIQAMDDMAKNLSVLRKAINTQDSKTLLEHLEAAKQKRDNLG